MVVGGRRVVRVELVLDGALARVAQPRELVLRLEPQQLVQPLRGLNRPAEADGERSTIVSHLMRNWPVPEKHDTAEVISPRRTDADMLRRNGRDPCQHAHEPERYYGDPAQPIHLESAPGATRITWINPQP